MSNFLFDCVFYYVADLDRAVRFYEDALGFRLSSRGRGGTATQKFDGWGRLIQAVNVHNGQVNYSYDAMSRVIRVTNPFTAGGTPGPATGYQYDALGPAERDLAPRQQHVEQQFKGFANVN